MNKTAIKNFAVWARRKLISEITYKAGLIGINEKGILQPLPISTGNIQFFDIGTGKPNEIADHEIKQRNALIKRIREKESTSDYKTAFQFVIEEVAYTWFNRLIAIRFMEVNDYLPSRIRVLSSETPGKSEPDMVTTPFDTDMEFSTYETDQILQLKQENKLDELFRMLFIKQCNKLNEVLPELFEKTADYTELLLTISFTDNDGIVNRLVNEIAEEDFTEAVEIIGWMYQYYNSEPKDEVFALLKKKIKITKERIPAATQLFTPDWIVRYMVENSLGRLWVEGHPNDDLKATWKYFLEEAEQEESVKADLEIIRIEYKKITPENIKIIDPCMGSGHILVYAFEVLMQIYESQGFTRRDAACAIIENNLYGLDIDDRAYQLAYFAIMMKARKYDRRFLTKGVSPKIYSIKESNDINKSHLQYFGNSLSEMERNLANQQMEYLISILKNAKDYGSILNVDVCNWELLNCYVDDLKIAGQMSLDSVGLEDSQKKLRDLLTIGETMASKYDVVATNPPYMGKKSLNAGLSEFMDKNYPNGKSELYSAFVLKCLDFTKYCGFTSMITIHTWMFISSFAGLRKQLIDKTTITSMVHTGASTFEELNSFNVLATAFCIRNRPVDNYLSKFIRLADYYNSIDKVSNFKKFQNEYLFKQKKFYTIPGNPLVYWISDEAINNFVVAKPIREYSEPKQGMATADNNQFVRNWFEVSIDKTNFTSSTNEESVLSGATWFPYNKGGNFRKWYGMNEYVVNWHNGGFLLRNFNGAVLRNQSYYFKQGITWSLFGFENFGVRYKEKGFLFDVSGSSMIPSDDMMLYTLAFLSSKVAFMYLSVLAPTVNFQVGNIGDLPLIVDKNIKNEIDLLSKECIEISMEDWDDFEESWNFKKHPLILRDSSRMNFNFDEWTSITNTRYKKLKSHEERINTLLIISYNLQNDITPDVVDRDIALRIADLQRDIKSFISYGIGCMFGRYSLVIEGLAYAGGKWDESEYTSFIPNKDNCILITDEEYFGDDIVGRFAEFVKCVYGAETLEENLDFIAKALGNKGNTSREIIRTYFVKDFYKDHIKTYQKRPIYWLYDSGKQDGFKALVYMHRYTADTTGIVRVDYLHKMQKIYMSEIDRMIDIAENSDNAREIAQAEKRKEKLVKQLKETKEYDEKIAHLAISRIAIDLDDGVKVNYEKVQTGQDGKKLDILGKI